MPNLINFLLGGLPDNKASQLEQINNIQVDPQGKVSQTPTWKPKSKTWDFLSGGAGTKRAADINQAQAIHEQQLKTADSFEQDWISVEGGFMNRKTGEFVTNVTMGGAFGNTPQFRNINPSKGERLLPNGTKVVPDSPGNNVSVNSVRGAMGSGAFPGTEREAPPSNVPSVKPAAPVVSGTGSTEGQSPIVSNLQSGTGPLSQMFQGGQNVMRDINPYMQGVGGFLGGIPGFVGNAAADAAVGSPATAKSLQQSTAQMGAPLQDAGNTLAQRYFGNIIGALLSGRNLDSVQSLKTLMRR